MRSQLLNCPVALNRFRQQLSMDANVTRNYDADPAVLATHYYLPHLREHRGPSQQMLTASAHQREGLKKDYFTTHFLETTIFVGSGATPRRSRSCQHGTAISPRSHQRQSYTHRKATPTLLNRQWPTGGLRLALLCHAAADYLIRKRAEVDLGGFSTASAHSRIEP